MHEGDDFAAHQELVERVVRRLIRELDLSCDPADLRAWGHQGVLEAKQRFDSARGVRFSTFAYYRVRGAVLDGVRSQGFIKRRAYAKLKAFEATDSLAEQYGEAQPTTSTLSPRRARATSRTRSEDQRVPTCCLRSARAKKRAAIRPRI